MNGNTKSRGGLLLTVCAVLFAAVFSFALAGCSSGSDDDGDGGGPKKTITIKNETSGEVAKAITGVAVYDQGGEKWLLGNGDGDSRPTTYDTTKTAAAGATMTPFDVTLTESSGFYDAFVYVNYDGMDFIYDTPYTSILDEGTTTAYTLKFYFTTGSGNVYRLVEEK